MRIRKSLLIFVAIVLVGYGCRSPENGNYGAAVPAPEPFFLHYERSSNDPMRKSRQIVLDIRPYGAAFFEATENSKPIIKTKIHLSDSQLSELAKAIRVSDVFSQDNSYPGNNCPNSATDGGTVNMFVVLRDKEKEIRHYTGCYENSGNGVKPFPPQLAEFEGAVERIVDVQNLLNQAGIKP